MREGRAAAAPARPLRARWSSVALAVAAALALAAGWPAAPAGSAPARPASVRAAPGVGACTDPSGVTVVVDFGAFGGGVAVRCAGWPVADGYDALLQANFAITDTTRFPGLLCRIDGLPRDQACYQAPPADAHWGYWHAERGGSWTYSSQGAASRSLEPGDVEGWAFGKAARPSIPPPAPPPTTTAPPPTAPPPSAAPAPAASAPTSSPSVPPGTAPGEDGGDEPGDEEEDGDVPATTAAGGGPGSDGSDGSDRERSLAQARDVDPLGASAEGAALGASGPVDDPGTGSPWPAVATAGVVVALVGGGVAIRRRRGAGA